jgi:hypothetical protein
VTFVDGAGGIAGRCFLGGHRDRSRARAGKCGVSRGSSLVTGGPDREMILSRVRFRPAECFVARW